MTSMPMLRAVPSTCFIAASMSLALRSASFVSAIWRTCSRDTRPTLSRRARPEAFSLPAGLRGGAAGEARALLVPGRLAEEIGGRRRLEDEGERSILEDRDLGGNDLAALVLGLLVVGLRELDDVDAVRAECRADGRRRRGCAGGQLQGQH